jgi:hypothetical protein
VEQKHAELPNLVVVKSNGMVINTSCEFVSGKSREGLITDVAPEMIE